MKKVHKSAASKKKVQAQPSGYHAVTPYLPVRGAAKAIDFYKQAFNAKEIMRMPGPDGKLGHVELQIGDSRVMLSDEHEEMNFIGPQSLGGTTVHMHLYVDDADKTFRRAKSLGAKEVRPVAEMFYGDRSGCVEDPFGHAWHISTHVKDIPVAVMKKKAAEMAQGKSQGAN
jgi:PhnB protein